MAAILSDAALPPGGEGKIEVKVSTSGRQGTLIKTATLETDDPEHPQTILKVSAEVVVIVGFETTYLHVGQVRKGEPWTRRLAVVAEKPDELKPGEFSSDIPGLTGKVISEKGPDGKMSHAVELKWTPTALGPARGGLRLATNHERYKQIEAGFFAQVEGELAFAPATIELWQDRPAGRAVLSSLGQRFKVTRIEMTEPRLVLAQRLLKPGRAVAIEARLKGKPATDSFFAVATVHTDSKEQPSLPLSISYRPAAAPPLPPGAGPGRGGR
jgi:hypothetical protein